jgi:hypothetical protein
LFLLFHFSARYPEQLFICSSNLSREIRWSGFQITWSHVCWSKIILRLADWGLITSSDGITSCEGDRQADELLSHSRIASVPRNLSDNSCSKVTKGWNHVVRRRSNDPQSVIHIGCPESTLNFYLPVSSANYDQDNILRFRSTLH